MLHIAFGLLAISTCIAGAIRSDLTEPELPEEYFWWFYRGYQSIWNPVKFSSQGIRELDNLCTQWQHGSRDVQCINPNCPKPQVRYAHQFRF